jgi:hypothetical protein
MDVNKITDATYLGFASAISSASGIFMISVSSSEPSFESSYSPPVAAAGLTSILLGVVLGLMTAYLAVSAYLSTYED